MTFTKDYVFFPQALKAKTEQVKNNHVQEEKEAQRQALLKEAQEQGGL